MIIRAPHDKANPFFQMLRATVQDENLPARALGVLVYLMSKPDTWEPTIDDICRRFSDVGRDQAQKIISKIFIPLRYAQRRQERKDGKITQWTIDVSETPLTENQVVAFLQPDFQEPDFQEHGFQEPDYHNLKTMPLDNIDKTKQRRKTKQRKEKTDSGTIVPAGGLSSDEVYALFVELRTTIGGYEAPYENKRADFVHVAKLLKVSAAASWPITRARFEQAARNYFATPQGAHTLADLATRFSEFYKNALNEFKRPTKGNGQADPLDKFSPAARKTIAAAEAWLQHSQEEEEL